MGITINLIPDASSRFTTDTGDWQGISTTLFRSTDVVDPNTGDPTLAFYRAGGTALVKYETNYLAVYNDEVVPWPLRAASRVKLGQNGQVVVYVTTVVGGASTTVSASASVIADEWTLVTVETEPISINTSHIEYGIYVTNTSAPYPAYVGYPTIISPWAVIYNTMAREAWVRLPDYMSEADVDRTDLDRPLLRFIDVMMGLAGEIYDTWSDWRWIPPEDNNKVIKESELVSPLAIPDTARDVLKWLIQIIGAKPFDSSTGFTPWGNLDYDDNPTTNDLTWAAFPQNSPGSRFDLNPVDNKVSWLEIQTFEPTVVTAADFLKWQITSAAYGFRAGTEESIVAAAKQALTGTQAVTLTPHYNGDVWHIRLDILAAEGDVAEVEESVTPSLPAGFELSVVAS